MVYIRQDKLPKLKEYKYSGVDHSLVSRYVLKPFYTNVAIKCFPMSMAPNAITLSGFGFVVINLLTLFYYTPTLDQDCPPWVYASWSIGVDACNTTLEVLIFAAAMNFGQGWKTVMTLFASLLTFYVQTWDEYHTHTLTLGLISGPVEGILTLVAVYALTAYNGGGSFWQQSLFRTLGLEKHGFVPDTIYELAFNEWYMVYGGVVLIFNTVQSALNVMSARRSRGQRADTALLGLLPFFTAWTLITAYLILQPVILHQHLVPFVFYVGLINAYSVGQMIVAHLTKSRFPFGNVLIVPLAFGVVDSLGPFLQRHIGFGWPSALGNDVYQVAFVMGCVGLGVGVYGTFVVDVIFAICDYLDIWCLTIKHPYNGADEKKNKKA
ncbi:hypothetical protein B0A49_06856 [Cryomyces minteri]|uniref:Ethanolaminephosphotransferase n=1 Tax=Cryomyces minteri TaxID=331657 RepID=A0A4U0WQY8_9PEZI|nr:hypothetical protein B0A49_06856 [Cryomyces minteri]